MERGDRVLRRARADRHGTRIGARILKEIRERLSFLENVGLGYLTLDRGGRHAVRRRGAADPAGDADRVGPDGRALHPGRAVDRPAPARQRAPYRDAERLRDLGNTVIVVEHDEDTMRAADHIVDIGPGAGEHGGRVVARGTADAVMAHPSDSITGAYLCGRRAIRSRPAAADAGWFGVAGAAEHNLKNIDVEFPLGQLVCVTGVSGRARARWSRTSSAWRWRNVNRTPREARRARAVHRLEAFDKVIDIDQSPIGRTPRSNPATYIGLFDHIRDAVRPTPEARARGYKPGGSRSTSRAGAARPAAAMADQDRDALPARRLRHLRGLPRDAVTTARRSRCSSRASPSPTCSTCPSRRRSSSSPRSRSCAALQTLHDVGPRLHEAGPARDHAVRRRGAARQARHRAVARRRPGGPSTSSTSRPPACTSTMSELLRGAPRLVDAGQHGAGDRAQPGRDQAADWVIDLGPEGGDSGGGVIAAGRPRRSPRRRAAPPASTSPRVPVYEADARSPDLPDPLDPHREA